jgi:hypothetical protein
MFTSGLIYIGAFIRFLFYKFLLKKEITFLELWNKTKYDQNLKYIKLSNHTLGFVTSVIITIIIIIVVRYL